MSIDIPLDNLLGISMSDETQEKIEKKPKIKNVLKFLQINKKHNRYAKEYLFEEIFRELETVKKYKKVYGTGPVIVPYEGDITIESYEMIKRKYTRQYCPYFYFNKMSESNKIQYMALRMMIDHELGIKNRTYKF